MSEVMICQTNGMSFSTVYKYLITGHKIKRASWGGYWIRNGDSVEMHCKDGSVLEIRETEDIFFTLGNIAKNDWVVVCDDYEINK